MLLEGHVFTAPDGLRGFDANQPITEKIARGFYSQGYRFCARYVRRASAHSYDLTSAEARVLLDVGFALSCVQHVAPEGWTPTAELGRSYGEVAASETEKIGIPPGLTLWCDLEGVAPRTSQSDVIAYCNAWHQAVASAGFVPGLYVGAGAGIDATHLYKSLRFTHYWGAYNLNANEVPAVRGLQMRQSVVKAGDRVAGFRFAFQVDTVMTDHLGGRPTMLGGDRWVG
jgi:glycoside hydrolase-like protein